MFTISVQAQDFDPGALERELVADSGDIGATACFTGYVRRDPTRPTLSGLAIEHYPGMTEKSVQANLDEAAERWPVQRAGVVHRIGPLSIGERIVWVGVASAHRAAAFAACDYIMDALKTTVPLWKRELGLPGEPWVEARDNDKARAARWKKGML